MSDFKDLLNKTLDNIEKNHHRDYEQEYDLVCGHTVTGLVGTLLISGAKVGLNRQKTLQVCPSCAHVLHDKNHPEHYTVKNLVRKKSSL